MINFRKNNISVIAILPAFTQCYDDRQDRNGKGWFVTRDGFSYTPHFLNLDERMPNLIPYLDYNKLMNILSNPPQWLYPNLSCTNRKRFAHVDNCSQAEILPTDHSQVVLNLDAKSKYPNLTRNQMQELSLINVLNFLIN
ncbi:unnamed protein product [Adineta steineri]|uniref:Uncharacterized protein n=1 Tax=Adineta steineri TaxID=433720 RepID=A0A819M152_9BILA|nr:unnamed protein product [Adineta steineri]CAF3972166.1 unnamed protein product [Adineta steineri]